MVIYDTRVTVFSRLFLLFALLCSVSSMQAGVQLRLKGGLQGKEEDSGALVTVIAEGDE
jgi:hypothetical protein